MWLIVEHLPVKGEWWNVPLALRSFRRIASMELKFINIARFMASLLSYLVDNLSEEVHMIKSKNIDMIIKNGENAKLNSMVANAILKRSY